MDEVDKVNGADKVDENSLIILGGYGRAGFAVARWLLRESDVSLIIAGRNEEKAGAAAARLRAEFPGRPVVSAFADASNRASLAAAFRKARMAVVCSTTASFVREVAEAALEAGIDYFDIQYPPQRLAVLQSLESAMRAAGRCFITEAGFLPGLPATFVHYAARRLDPLRRATVAGLLNVKISPAASIDELSESILDYRAHVFKEGQWRKASYRDVRRVDFGADFGERICYPVELAEMRALPQRYGLEETGVYMAGFNWFVDYVGMFPGMALGKICRRWGVRFLSKMLVWGINTFAKPPFGVMLKIIAEGEREGKACRYEMASRHDDEYEFTAIPAVACLLQYLDGAIRKPGLWMMGHAVDSERLIKDMERMGVGIEERFSL